MITDEELLEQVVAAARQPAASPGVVSSLRAIASTRDEARRHELERQARERAGQLTAVGLELLRVVFQIAVA